MLRSFGKEDEEDAGRAFDLRIIWRLLAFLKPHWRSMAVALVMMVISSGLNLATPYLVKVAIDQHITEGDLRRPVSKFWRRCVSGLSPIYRRFTWDITIPI
jgi:ATP-binding cassette subfamily B protein/subfamily B ATP-binding cassette protein MsbA